MKNRDFASFLTQLNSENKLPPTIPQILTERLYGFEDSYQLSGDLVLYCPRNQGELIKLIRTRDNKGNLTKIGQEIFNAILLPEENFISPIISNPSKRITYTEEERSLACEQIKVDNETVFEFNRHNLIKRLREPLESVEAMNELFYKTLARDENLWAEYVQYFLNPKERVAGASTSFMCIVASPRLKAISIDSAKNGTHFCAMIPMYERK